MQSRKVYDLALEAAGIIQKGLPKNKGMLRYLPPPFNGWTRSRDMQPVAAETFSTWWRKNRKGPHYDRR